MSEITDNSKVVIREFLNEADMTCKYSSEFDLDTAHKFTGRIFQLYQNPATDRIPVYQAIYTHPTAGFVTDVLTVNANPTSLPGISLPVPRPRPLGYITTSNRVDRISMRQHWARENYPKSYRYDTIFDMPGYVANTTPNNLPACFVPKVATFGVTIVNGNVDIRDSSGAAVSTITIQPGEGNLIHFTTTQANLEFATFSIYKLAGNNTLQQFDGRFCVNSWSPKDVYIVDDNNLTGGTEEFNFLLSMRNGDTYYQHDPKIKNLSESQISGV